MSRITLKNFVVFRAPQSALSLFICTNEGKLYYYPNIQYPHLRIEQTLYLQQPVNIQQVYYEESSGGIFIVDICDRFWLVPLKEFSSEYSTTSSSLTIKEISVVSTQTNSKSMLSGISKMIWWSSSSSTQQKNRLRKLQTIRKEDNTMFVIN